MVSWNGENIYFGGDPYFNTTYKYSQVTNSWTTLSSLSDMYGSGCVVLPNQNVLVAGSAITEFSKRYAIFNVSSNTWLNNSFGITPHYRSTALVLKKRVFTISGYGKNDIEEFHYNNNTVSTKPFKLLTTRSGKPSAIALPANLFSHLPGVNFINVLRAPFSYKSLCTAFLYLITF
jgi:hypothetical protein